MQEEELLHTEAIGYLTTARQYHEVFADSDEASKARLDSVGRLAGKACFIEVKCKIGPREASHIESKLSGSFRGHADPDNDHPQFVAMRSIWDGRTFPLVATIARKYTTKGLKELSEMLDARSRTWKFDYEIWEWVGDRLVTRASDSSSEARTRDPDVYVEKVQNSANCKKNPRTMEEFRGIARKNGVLDLFDHAIALGRNRGLKCKPMRRGVTLTPRGRSWLFIRLDRSSAEIGLVLNYNPELVRHLAETPSMPPGSGQYRTTACVAKDRDVLTRLVHAAADAASRQGIR